jgi:hypothetical protein
MARAIHRATKGSVRHMRVGIGTQLLDIVSSGMYTEPLMCLREYVQNSADSLDTAIRRGVLKKGMGEIFVHVDPESRNIRIEDNGCGVSNDIVSSVLCDLGHSNKEGDEKQRGFRGIGRLGGLGYCDRVVFETRSGRHERVANIEWDGHSLREAVTKRKRTLDLKSLIRKSVRITYLTPKSGEPSRFFRVTMQSVKKFHKDNLISIPEIRRYLGRVAPIPYDAQAFPYANEIETHVSAVSGYSCHKLYVNDKQLFKPYAHTLEVTQSKQDLIRGVELIDFTEEDGRCIGRGWFSKTDFMGAFPSRVAMRGISVRQGNIEVGDEYFLADSFAERRFCLWQVGEIHLDLSVTPNARRDGFEQTPSFERFLEQASVLGRHLSRLCRISSRERCKKLSAERTLGHIETLLDMPLFVDQKHCFALERDLRMRLSRLEKDAGDDGYSSEFRKRLDEVNNRFKIEGLRGGFIFDHLDDRRVSRINRKDLICDICSLIVKEHKKSSSGEELIQKIVRPYLWKDYRRNGR